jgi:aryl-alcohol dehydrogenase-like predicted oxidoreductase
MALMDGRASPEGTEEFASEATSRGIVRDHFRHSRSGLHLSSIGLGTYLGPADAATDSLVEQAVQICLSSRRVNVLDTAINYRFQRAERSVGRALQRAVGSGAIRRDQVFVATKNGYLAPDAESGLSASDWVSKELIRPGVLRPADIVDGSHAMTVRFLEDQLERSRRNLGVATVDLLYLHNAPDAQLPLVGSDEFLARLKDAFGFYEKKRAEGSIGWYGLATWDSLRTQRTDPAYLPLEDAVRVAREAGGPDHGLRFIQFPFNLMMPEAAVLRNQVVDGERRTLFEAARALGLECFTSVPLLQGQLARSGRGVDELSPAQTALQFARSVPETIGPLVGQKQATHLSENLSVAEHSPWDEAIFRKMLE